MSERKFKFVSPGVFVDEIDNSQLSREPGDIGPVIIGRTERGPAMRPVKVNSFSEFVEAFGNPIPGGSSVDVYRNGNYSGPTYAAYAAQAWFKNNNAATIVRLLGAEHSSAIASTDGQAGWDTSMRDDTNGQTGPSTEPGNGGGAFGLFMIDSGSVNNSLEATGALAAIFYATSGTYFTLSGALPSMGTTIGDAQCEYIRSSADKEFVLHIRKIDSAATTEKIRFNFTDSSSKYIRKVFNTNPQLANSTITTSTGLKHYWLGESYDGHVANHIKTSNQLAFLAPLHNSTPGNACLHRRSMIPSRTGYVFAQDLTEDTGSYSPEKMQKLFRFVSIENGEWEQKNLKISIQDIKKSTTLESPYGTFTVVIRMTNDSDNSIKVVERFTGCNLNPNSNDYIAKKIGDSYSTWSDTERRHRFYGRFPNVSKYVRMDMNIDVDNGGVNGNYLPAGFVGAPRYMRFGVVVAGNQGSFSAFHNESLPTSLMITGAAAIPTGISGTATKDIGAALVGNDTYPYLFPAPSLRVSASDGAPPHLKQCYWGVTTSKVGGTSTAFDESYKDTVRILADGALDSDGIGDPSNAVVETSYFFSLDDISGSSGQYVYVSGSRAAGTSARGTSTFDSGLLDNDIDRFTLDLHGGFDGLDITEKEPFRHTFINSVSTTPYDRNNYAYNTIKRAVDSIADPEVAEYNLMTCPGVYHDGLTSHMMNVCEDRGDALAVIDLDSDFRAFTENSSNAEARKGSVATVVSNLTARSINTSYGCAYYPWVQIRDPQQGNHVWVPPSVVALGTMASSEKKSELWFAPAGFNRGGLTEGSAGLPVVGVADRLSADDRDTLYAANINPIATFPAEGIVIFGQKTLQATPSALDRINVRRLMIYVKKEISRMASRVLFDQNVQATWNRFLGMVKPFLRDIKIRFGLTAFKVVLDETTTTPDVIDRNILYAKIFLKPARAIEFIALDFTITNSGASFED